jgi:hypothetical protein
MSHADDVRKEHLLDEKRSHNVHHLHFSRKSKSSHHYPMNNWYHATGFLRYKYDIMYPTFNVLVLYNIIMDV